MRCHVYDITVCACVLDWTALSIHVRTVQEDTVLYCGTYTIPAPLSETVSTVIRLVGTQRARSHAHVNNNEREEHVMVCV